MKRKIILTILVTVLVYSVKSQYSADLCNNGVASASSIYSASYAAAYAFDNYLTYGNCWASAAAPTSSAPQWLKYDFGASNPVIIQKYTIAARYQTGDQGRCPRDWTFEASNDNVNWVVLDTRTNETGWNTNTMPTTKREYTFSNNTAYRYYRIHITANNGGTGYVAIGEMEMMGPVVYTNYPNKRSNVWYFGNYAGLDFNTDPITVLTNSAMLSREGCSSICDTLGNLLFYTDGYRVWNRNHVLMENGDSLAPYNPLNMPHSTQAGVIVPHPGNPQQYYIFTTPCMWTTPSANRYFSYSLVDMSYNGGLGKVIQKNIRIMSYKASERVTAVAHSNRHDIWVINHEDNTNKFRAYLVTNTGIDTANPVISVIGAVSSGDCNVGQLKASPDGKKLAMAFWCNAVGSHFELYDFNNTTGVISNLNDLGYPSGLAYQNAYGVEFSPDGTKLYGSTLMAKRIYQWNLMAGSNQDIKNSRVEVGVTTNNCGALQLAPNGKIYCAMAVDGNTGYHTIGVINNPNSLGVACGYSNNGIRVDVNYTGTNLSRQGFPNYIQSYLYVPPFNYSPVCYGQPTCFTISNLSNVTSVLWNFGDPSSGTADTSTSFTPCHLFTSPGTYQVKLKVTFVGGSVDSTIQNVVIYEPMQVNLNDYTVCSGTSLVIDAGNGFSQYQWSTGATTQSINILANVSQNYIVTVTDANGCYDVDTATVTIGGNISVNLNDVTYCEGTQVILDAGIPNATYLWAPGNQTTQTITISSPGIYYLTVSLSGCSGSDSVVVTQLPAPNVTIYADGPTTFCLGDSVILHSNLTGVNYMWLLNGNQTGITDSVITVKTSGVYSLQLTGNNSCQGVSNNIQINVSPPPAAIIPAIVNPICQGDSVLLTVQAFSGGSYQWLFNGNIIPNATDTFFWASQEGDYNVVVSSNVGCSDTSTTVHLTVLDIPISNINIIGNDTLCYNNYSTILYVNHSTGNSYQWYINNTPIPNATDSLYIPVISGSYSLQISNIANCTFMTQPISITVIQIPNISSLHSNSPVCRGDTIKLFTDFIPNVEYNWSGPNGFSSHQQNPIIVNASPVNSGVYELYLTSNGCSGPISQLTVNVVDLPNITTSNDTSICEGSMIMLFANGGNSYQWSNSASTNVIYVSPITSTIYTVTVGNGTCYDTAQILVNVIPKPIAYAGNDTSICQGSSVVLTAYGGSYYQWNTGQNSQSIQVNPNTTSTYVVTVSNNYCSSTDAVTVHVLPIPLANAGNDTIICAGNSVTLVATGGTSYTWSNGQQNSSIVVNPSVTTSYTVTVSNGPCYSTDDVTINVQEPPVIVVSNDTVICSGTSVYLFATGGDSYLWSTSNTTSSIVVSPVSSHTYYVTVTKGQCKVTEDVIVTVIPTPQANAGNDQTICQGQSTTLTATGGQNYLWNTSQTTATIQVSPTITTTYTVTVSNGNCSSTDQVTVFVVDYPNPIVSSDTTLCAGQSVNLFASGGQTYLWSNGQTTSSINVNPTQTTVFSVTISNNNCRVVRSITVNVIPLPSVNAGPDRNICEGDVVLLNATVQGNYSSISWISSGTGMFSNSTTTATSYTPSSQDISNVNIFLTINVNSQCGNVSDTVVITILSLPEIEVGPDRKICPEDSLKLSVVSYSGATSYLWVTDGNGHFTSLNSSNTIYVPSESDINDGLVWIFITAINSCGQTKDSLQLSFYSSPNVDAGNNVKIEAGQSIVLHASGALNYVWTPDVNISCTNCPDPEVSPLITTVYTVIGIDNNGCMNIDSVMVEVVYSEEVFIPNGFSPNNDGKNDVLYVRGSGIKSMNFIVFDRWGEKVFESHNVRDGWDGTYNGVPLDPGVFSYYLKVIFYNGNSKVLKGNVTLFR